MQTSDFHEPDGERRLIDPHIAAGWLTALWRIELSQVMTHSTRQRTHAERQRKVARSMRAEARAMLARVRLP